MVPCKFNKSLALPSLNTAIDKTKTNQYKFFSHHAFASVTYQIVPDCTLNYDNLRPHRQLPSW